MERRVWASPQSPAEALALAQAAADLISPRDGVSTSPFRRGSASKKSESNTRKLFEYADVRTKQAMLMEMGRTPDEALKELRHRERVILADAGDEAAQVLVALDKREYLKVSAALGQVALLRLGDEGHSNSNPTRLLLNQPSSPKSPRSSSQLTGSTSRKPSLASPLSKPPPPPPPPASKGALGGIDSLSSPRTSVKSQEKSKSTPTTASTTASKPSTAANSRRGSTTSKINAHQEVNVKSNSKVSTSVAQSAIATEGSDDNLAEHARLTSEVAELELLAALGQKALANASE
jgi:hypothetical protein